MARANVNATTISQDSSATSAKRVSTISPLVKIAIATRQVLCRVLQVAAPFRPGSFANAKKEWRVAFVTSVDRSTGISIPTIPKDVRNASVMFPEWSVVLLCATPTTESASVSRWLWPETALNVPMVHTIYKKIICSAVQVIFRLVLRLEEFTTQISDCDCDVGGSVNNICDKSSGQCLCQARVTGRTCKEPLQAHYFPTLYQYQYEAEDGHTPANTVVRHANDEKAFPRYSWKGYAVFSLLQNVILQDIHIYKPSLYRMALRFVNNNPDTVIGTIKITPDNPSDNEQEFQVQFKNTSSVPAFVTVSGATGNTPSPFVMNPGRWQISIKVDENLLLVA
jgi:hypothetical protein